MSIRNLFTRRRLVLYLIAAALMGVLWQLRWRLWSEAVRIVRPSHPPLSAEAWWKDATGPAGLLAATPLLEDVTAADRPELVRRARGLPEDAGLTVLWFLLLEGNEEANQAIVERCAEKRPLDLARALPAIDLSGVCADRKPLTPLDVAVKRAAALLMLAGSTGPVECPPSETAALSVATLELLLARASSGPLSDGCAGWILARLDDASLPAAVRRRLFLLAGLLGDRGVRVLEQRLLESADSQARTWSALALVAGQYQPISRQQSADRLKQAVAAGKAVDPSMAEQAARELQTARPPRRSG